jgi:hypothetical protein
MTPNQSLTRKQSLIRCSFTVLSAALLTMAWMIGISIPASAQPVRGSLDIVSVTNIDNPEFGLIVQGQRFAVQVRVLDNDGQPTTVSRATTIVLEEVSGPGELGGTTTAVIPRRGSGETISGATYSQFANNVVLRVRATSGVELAPDEVTVDVALTAVGANANRGQELDLDDPNCGAGSGVPTSDEPTCGHLLTAGADGLVVMSVGSCQGLGSCRQVGETTALVVTISADIAPLPNSPHSTLILSCDKDLCGGSGVPKIDVIYTFDNTADLTQTAPECPAKGVLGDLQEICVDYVQSTRSAGDLFIYVLFAHDLRSSHG